ncbi:hypothetical protein [Alkalicoccobacillus porphyridii]|uniref:DUF4190 domain-containing protein n=1 Tax=Alkalicoccobacillus porphyridii TaxID=2597270 RepID=A0A553ZY65_9BACI|nr:hypothetical protein [Alkalicoccobacillus porphyridii]TSB46389.1 hypothetical protein FN960_11320 [Alkalicoccobacillus porphyridii]
MTEIQNNTETNTLGILSLVFGILSLSTALFTFLFGAFLGIPALIFAIYAFKQVKAGSGKAFEIAGLVTSSIASFIGLIVMILMIIAFSMR